MSRLSVPEAAARLGVSPGRIRQRIAEGSLVAEQLGGRWVVDLDAAHHGAQPANPRPGRRPEALSVWRAIQLAENPGAGQFAPSEIRIAGPKAQSQPSQWRVIDRVRRLRNRVDHGDPARLAAIDDFLSWLGARAHRKAFQVSERDLSAVRADARLVMSGLSHPFSEMEDVRVVEAYVDQRALVALVARHWLEPVAVGTRANVYLHVVPDYVMVSAVGPVLVAADLFEHGGPREVDRARQLLAAVLEEVGQ